jgi:outer membrane protein insertion porin family
LFICFFARCAGLGLFGLLINQGFLQVVTACRLPLGQGRTSRREDAPFGGLRSLIAAVPMLLALALLAGSAQSQALRLQDIVTPGPTDRRVDSLGRVRAIRVDGTRRIDASTVRSYLTMRIGDAFHAEQVDASLEALFETGLFRDLVLSREGDTLVVSVDENPVINRIAFEGNRRINDDQLRSEISLRERVVFTRTRVRADAARLEELYRRQGRFAVNIVPKTIEREQNRVDLVFEIQEGPISRVRRIDFIGNRAFADDALRREIQTSVYRFFRLSNAAAVYDPERLSFDRELLRRFYFNHGYADFRVISAVAELTPDRRDFFVTFTLDEGQLYQFGKIEVVSEIDELAASALVPALSLQSGESYDASVIEDNIDRMIELAGEQQFAFVDVRPEVSRNRETRTVDLVLRIREGRRVFVERIDITNNTRTLDRVIRRELALVEGDPYSPRRLERSRTAVQDLGFFEQVEVFAEPGSAPDKIRLRVDVVEQSTGWFDFAGGFSTSAGPLGVVQYRERNLLGRGQDLQVSFTLSGVEQQFDIGLTEPRLFERDLAAGIDLFNTSTQRRNTKFDERRTGFGLRLAYPLSRRWRQSLNYEFEITDISDVDKDASRLIRDQEGKNTVSAVSQKLTYDTRNSRLFPTTGLVASLDTRLSGLGGDIRNVQYVVNGARYWSLAEDVTLVVRGRAGLVMGLGQDVPIFDRFFLGGDNLRGFESAGVGPRDGNDALGGNSLFTGGTQLNFPLPIRQLRDAGLSGQIFGDFGNVNKVDSAHASVRDPFAIRSAVGAGMTWRSPLGPVTIEYAFPVTKEDFDKTEALRLSFGTRF